MNHRLTNQAIDNLWDEAMIAAGPPATILEVSRAICRAAYDLGYKAGTQASEGAMQAILDTIQQNSKAMEMLADS